MPKVVHPQPKAPDKSWRRRFQRLLQPFSTFLRYNFGSAKDYRSPDYWTYLLGALSFVIGLATILIISGVVAFSIPISIYIGILMIVSVISFFVFIRLHPRFAARFAFRTAALTSISAALVSGFHITYNESPFGSGIFNYGLSLEAAVVLIAVTITLYLAQR